MQTMEAIMLKAIRINVIMNVIVMNKEGGWHSV